MTIAIASLLNLELNHGSKQVWDLLEIRCREFGMESMPIPHFSWQVADDYDLDQLIPAVSGLVSTWQAFTVRTVGLGLFTGISPVLYLPIIKTKCLMEKQQQLWELGYGFGKEVSPLYSPDNWIPHVTLIHQGFTLANASCVIDDLYQRTLNMEFMVQKVEIMYQCDDEEGIKVEFSLQKG